MLGPFEITGPLGQGAMGTVWKGRHRGDGRPVAIKVLRAEFVNQQKYLEGFHGEVRAIARLSHPGIVQLLDYGEISAAAAEAYDELQEHSLWLAMEFARGGSLDEEPAKMSWAQLRGLLIQILDALAHAHARGLVHRDLKPANILVQPADDADASPRWLLSDFGIAHIQDPKFSSRTGDINATAAGTPLFMSPEQLHGQWRDYGPWTDLYSLGCVAYLLSCGRPPFEGDSVMAIAIKHISDTPPALTPMLDVPPGFENWVHRLMAKRPVDRYRRAVDAATDLMNLGDPQPSVAPSSPVATGTDRKVSHLSTGPTESFDTLLEPPSTRTLLLETATLEPLIADDLAAHQQPTQSTRTQPLPRIASPPPSWRRPGQHRPPQAIPATGKGIFGLRKPPYIGRADLRDELWSQLRQVHQSRRAQKVLIEGRAGMGKSSLMMWLATRAHELGIATPLVATHSPIMNPSDGLPHTFRTFLGATGLQRSALFERLQTVYRQHLGRTDVDPEFLAAIVEWLSPRADHPDSDDDLPRVTLDTSLERYLVIEQLVADIAQRRPVILGIDDGQWGQDSLGFARHLLAHQDSRPLPVLIVSTIRGDALKNRLMEQEILEILESLEGTISLSLDPLSDADQYQLVELMLGLDPSVVDSITECSQGLPLYPLQLIEEWVSADMLIESEAGYLLADEAPFPTSLTELMELRVHRVVSSWTGRADATTALEIAAGLGIDINREEWTRICQAAGLTVDEALIDHLMVHGLAVPHPGGWRFRLPIYRDVLETISRRHGRWAGVHSTIADTIETSAQNGTCLAERRARHLLAANRRPEALPQLWQAIDDRMQKSAYIQARALLVLVEQTLDDMDMPPDDPQRARLILRRVETLRYRGNRQQGQQLLDELLQSGTGLDDELSADAHRIAANYANINAEFSTARRHYQTALHLFELSGNRRGVAQCLDGLGWIYVCVDQLEAARTAYLQGYDAAQHAGHPVEAAWCLRGAAEVAYLKGEDQGYDDARRALAIFDSVGCRSGCGVTHRTLGDYARRQGEIETARNHYQRAQHLAHMIGHLLASFATNLIALCDLAAGDWEEARQKFTQFNAVIPDDASPGFRPLGDVGLLTVAALQGDETNFDALAHSLAQELTPHTPLKYEYMELFAQAADAWQNRGDQRRHDHAQQLLDIFVESPENRD